jgi:shikimate kinase
MSKRILIIGPSGSGKTYVSSVLRRKGINAVDADLVPDLSAWFDAIGNEVECPPDADQDFLENHQFLWDREVLEKFLQGQNDLYLFGLSGNVFDILDLFDMAYFLKAHPEVLSERLRHESRENPMGKTKYQLQNALKYAKELEDTARKHAVTMIDANQSPEAIFSQIEKYSE